VPVTETQILTWLGLYAWPFMRIGAALMAAPLFGSRALPRRLRLVFALALTLVIAPTLPAMPPLQGLSAQGFVIALHEVLLGLMIGFALQCVFEAVSMGGELISFSMGLSFAQMADPLRGTASPVLANFLQALAILSFLALGGHLALVQWLVQSFHQQPVAGGALHAGLFFAMLGEGDWLLAGALRVALPAVCALLLVNLAFGVMNRSAPAINMSSVGFPIALTAGLVLLAASLGNIQSVFTELLQALAGRLPVLLAGAP
jgi:flagellar biosynthesis protein FliR